MHTHILLFGSKFHIILAMYVQMLDMYIENMGYFRYFRKYHDIFQPCTYVKMSATPLLRFHCRVFIPVSTGT